MLEHEFKGKNCGVYGDSMNKSDVVVGSLLIVIVVATTFGQIQYSAGLEVNDDKPLSRGFTPIYDSELAGKTIELENGRTKTYTGLIGWV